MNTYKTKVLVC